MAAPVLQVWARLPTLDVVTLAQDQGHSASQGLAQLPRRGKGARPSPMGQELLVWGVLTLHLPLLPGTSLHTGSMTHLQSFRDLFQEPPFRKHWY